MAAGCGPNQQQDPSAGKFKPVVFTSITQHATEANYTHIIICQLKIVLPPPNSHANAPGAQAQTCSPPCGWQPCWAFSSPLLATWAAMTREMLDSALFMAADRTPLTSPKVKRCTPPWRHLIRSCNDPKFGRQASVICLL